MSATNRGKHKQQAEVSEEEDFQTFVRESLGQLSKGQKQIIQDISNLKAKVKLNETADTSNESYDVNESLTRFFHTFNSHAPLKSINIKNKSDKPWVTNGLRKSIKIRKELHKKWLTTRNIYYHKQYKIYRNKIVSINKALRILCYDSVLKDSTKTKKMWDNVNLIINKKRSSSNIDNLKVKDKNLQQPFSISNAINRYFCNVPTELASKLPKADRHF